MCILFFHFCDNPVPNGFRFIAASNRDELYERPTAQARFWDENKRIISGIDLTPGKAGGTWLGFTKDGRFSSLTNYRQAPKYNDPNARGRGHLVTNFLQGRQKPEDYQHEVSREGELYNGFNLLVGELSSNTDKSSEFAWYCNMEEQPVKVIKPGTHVLTNRFLNFPWPKAVYGKRRFNEIIKQHSDSEEKLIDELLKLLNEKQRHFPDEDDSCYIGPQDDECPKEFIEACRAIHVHCEEFQYGTRTNTVILVDYDGSVTYVERAMLNPKEPLDTEWSVKTHKFVVESLQEKLKEQREKVNDEPCINNNQMNENLLGKRPHQDDPEIGEPMKKKPNTDGSSSNEEDVKLGGEAPSCTSCGTVEDSPAIEQKGKEQPAEKGRVVTNGTV